MIIVSVSVIGSSILTFIIGITLGVLCGMKCMQKIFISKQNIRVPEENLMRPMKGPIYEEVELEDKATTINLSQNIAYEQVRKTVS